MGMTGKGAGIAESPQAECPIWALVAENEWHELTVMGLATEALAEHATTVIQDTCAPLSIGTTTELDGLLADGFRDNSDHPLGRSEAHTSELQSLMRIAYAVFCLNKKTTLNS